MNNNEVFAHDDEIEINLASLFWAVMAKWRKILVWALALAVLLGAYKGVKGLEPLRDSEGLAEAEKEYEITLSNYETKKARLETQMLTLDQEIKDMRNYAENSALFAIDPYNVFIKDCVFKISTETDREPSDAIQEAKDKAALFLAYKNAIESINVEALLAGLDEREEDLTVGGGKKFITVSIWETNSANEDNMNFAIATGLFEVKVVGADTSQVNAIMEAVEKTMAANKSIISERIQKHAVTAVSSTEFQSVSDELAKFHDDFQRILARRSKQLNDAITEYEELTEPTLSKPSITGAIKGAVKYAILGFALGGVLCAGYYVVMLILKGTVTAADDIYSRYHMPTLGVLPIAGKANRLDRWIAGHRGIPPESSESDARDLAVADVKQAAGALQKLMFTGSVKAAAISELGQQLAAKLEGVELMPAGNVCTDATSVYALKESDAVILVEEIGQSSHSDIEREIIKIQNAGKKILGFLLVGKERQ